jgi:hypothetical protein
MEVTVYVMQCYLEHVMAPYSRFPHLQLFSGVKTEKIKK